MSKSKSKPKHTTGPRAVGALIRWRKGPAEGGAEEPKEAQRVLIVLGANDEILDVPYLPGVFMGDWKNVRFWIPYIDICPAALLPSKRKGRK